MLLTKLGVDSLGTTRGISRIVSAGVHPVIFHQKVVAHDLSIPEMMMRLNHNRLQGQAHVEDQDRFLACWNPVGGNHFDRSEHICNCLWGVDFLVVATLATEFERQRFATQRSHEWW